MGDNVENSSAALTSTAMFRALQNSSEDVTYHERWNGTTSPDSGNGTIPGASPAGSPPFYQMLGLLIFPLLTVFGNVLVCMSIYREKSLRTVTNYFIVSLAVADIMVAVLVMPLAVYVEVKDGVWMLGDALCDAWVAFDVMCCTASILNLAAISIDRYIAVTLPIQYAKHKNSKRVLVMLTLTWVLSAGISSPIAFGMNYTERRTATVCVFYNSDFLIYSSMGSFYIPCIAMMLLYWRIFRTIRLRMRRLKAYRKPAQTATSTSSTSLPSKCSRRQTKNLLRHIGSIDPCVAAEVGNIVETKDGELADGERLLILAEDAHPNEVGGDSNEEDEDERANKDDQSKLVVHRDDQSKGAAHKDDQSKEAANKDIQSTRPVLPPGHDVIGNGNQTATGMSLSLPCSVESCGDVAHCYAATPNTCDSLVTMGEGKTPASDHQRDADDDVTNPLHIRCPSTDLVPPADQLRRVLDFSSARVRAETILHADKLTSSKIPPDALALAPQKLNDKSPVFGGSKSLGKNLDKLSANLCQKLTRSTRCERKAIKTLAIVMGVFLFCWVPFFTINIINAVCIRYDNTSSVVCQIPPKLFSFFVWLGYINSFLNPVIYTIFNVEFRRAFNNILREMISCKRTR